MTEMKALPLLASLSPQEGELHLRFHALGNHPPLETFAHTDNRAHDGGVIRIGGYVAHE